MADPTHYAEPAPVVDANLAAFDLDAWNRLVGDCAQARYQYVRAMDAASRREHRYCVRASADAYLCATRLTFLDDADSSLGPLLYGRAAAHIAKLGVRIGPAVTCGWPQGRRRAIAADARLPAAQQAALVDEMCAAVESIAAGRAVVFHDVLDDDEALTRTLQRRGYCVASSLPTTRLDVEWENLEGYLRHLKRRNKNWGQAARSEVKRFRRSGATIERFDGSAQEWERICDLLNRHHERLNAVSPGHTAAKLQQLRDSVGEDFLVYVSREHGTITGATVGIRHGSDAAFNWVGIDYTTASDNFTYFNLVYYALMDEVAALKLERIWLGNAAYPAKIRRGCIVIPSKLYVKLPRVLQRAAHAPAFLLQRAWYGRKFAPHIKASRP